MNLMMIKRFRNELMVLVAALFMLLALGYKLSAKGYVADQQQEIQTTMEEISQVVDLKAVWSDKNIDKTTDQFKTIVVQNKIQSFEKRSKKMVAKYSDLDVKDLNNIAKQLFKTPVQITQLQIQESGKEKFTMELTCIW
ncbi:MAG: hypothetical protein IE889_00265 [Campylobacterales bacterium]|nr:hypothetical protein [Campylobacterales bacterium]